jgi:RNA polymerase sigma-70 factor (ECF subfamily)
VLLHELSDTALIQRFMKGEESAFRELYARHTPRLRAIVWRLLGNRDEAEDVVQETWLAACRGMRRFNGTARFSSWLTTIGIRTAYRRSAMLPNEEPLPELAVGSDDGPATVVHLERAIARLPAHQRAVVVLHDVEGFTHEEIAEQLGVAVGTSKGTLSRAREALRRMLNDGVSHVP